MTIWFTWGASGGRRWGSAPFQSGRSWLTSLGLSADSGLLIVQVVPGSAAEHAGLRAGTERAYLGNIPIMIGGDLIVAIDGQAIEDQQDLSHVMQNHRSGDTVTVTVFRGKKRMDVKVVLGEARGVA